MAIADLVAVTVAGKTDEFDRIVGQYITSSDIHLENVMTVLGEREKLEPFLEDTSYDELAKKAENILKIAKMPEMCKNGQKCSMSFDEMNSFVDKLSLSLVENKKEKAELLNEADILKKSYEDIKRIKNIDCDIGALSEFSFIKYRYGHIPKTGYKLLNTYLSSMNILFIKVSEDETGVWGFYFTCDVQAEKVDEIFTSLYFERIEIPENMTGTPDEILTGIEKRLEEINARLSENEKKSQDIIKDSTSALQSILTASKASDSIKYVREKSAHSKDFFYIVGWMTRKDASRLEKKIERDKDVILFYQEEPENLKGIITPPTKLKNNPISRPFEFFVNMYGRPGYNEIDPTPILALTYILFFGMMFGDVGQSAVFAILGFIVYKKTKMALASIVSIVGLSGIVFGALYGSVFGNEEIIHGILPPMQNITTLLIGTISLGAVIIVVGMLLNTAKNIKNHNYCEMLMSHNGIAGIVFYVSLIILALSILLKSISVPKDILIILMVVSLLLMYLREPITALVHHEKLSDGFMTFVQSFFELFEVLLSYFSNTISFLRIGAFSIVHVGMMLTVSVLAKGGTVKFIIVSILGNILVMVLEGLIVGIQVLRLEYYEMFSRYFTGNGKQFISLKDKIKK